MTRQMRDTVCYRGKKYILIDVEQGKQLIDCANFIMPEKNGYVNSSACHRGYTATYEIEADGLYGIRHEQDCDGVLSSEKMFFDFTGSIIMAMIYVKAKKWYVNSDYLESYLEHDEAWEVHFTHGKLDGFMDLYAAIKEYEELKKTKEYEEMVKSKRRKVKEEFDFGKKREEIARKYLRFQYDDLSYKSRTPEYYKLQERLKEMFHHTK